MLKIKCSICGYVYDESAGIPEKGIAPGTRWEDLGDDFKCPVCTAPKSVFAPVDEAEQLPQVDEVGSHAESLKELSCGEIAAICSSLAKGCEKQRLNAEMEAFAKIAEYYSSKADVSGSRTFEDAAGMLAQDLSDGIPAANNAAKSVADRGAQRSLVWSEKVSIMMKTLLERYAKDGDDMLANTRIFVCDICGFIYIGDNLPDICPVCKVPNYKILEVERR